MDISATSASNITDKLTKIKPDHQLNNSLTSMEWLFPLAINKHMLNNPKIKDIDLNNTTNILLSVPIHDGLNNTQQKPSGPNVIPVNFNYKPPTLPPQPIISSSNSSSHSIAQRAEPHRPM